MSEDLEFSQRDGLGVNPSPPLWKSAWQITSFGEKKAVVCVDSRGIAGGRDWPRHCPGPGVTQGACFSCAHTKQTCRKTAAGERRLLSDLNAKKVKRRSRVAQKSWELWRREETHEQPELEEGWRRTKRDLLSGEAGAGTRRRKRGRARGKPRSTVVGEEWKQDDKTVGSEGALKAKQGQWKQNPLKLLQADCSTCI